jgi:23S rRNA (guanosine2251-2'-O)-methyltransferase
MKKFKKPKAHHRPGQRAESRERRPENRHRNGSPEARELPKGRIVVGIHAVTELLKVRPRAVSQVWLRDKYIDHPDLSRLFDFAKSQKVRVELKNPSVLDRIIASHQGILAFSEQQPEIDWPALEKAETATLVALDEVEDPHNLGAIMRTAWLLGARGILTPEHRSVDLAPAVSKVAQGAAEHVPVEPDNALPERLKRLKDHGFWILGLSHKATQNLFELEIPKKVVWVLGSESSGLRKSVEGACDDLISIPQAAADASYNVSVAAAMALGETFRQRIRL